MKTFKTEYGVAQGQDNLKKIENSNIYGNNGMYQGYQYNNDHKPCGL